MSLHEISPLGLYSSAYDNRQELGEARRLEALQFIRVARVTTPEVLGLFLGLHHSESRSRLITRLQKDKLIKIRNVGHPRYRKLIFLTKKGFQKGYEGPLSYRPKSKISIRTIDHDLVVQAVAMGLIERLDEDHDIEDPGTTLRFEIAFSPVLNELSVKKPDAVIRLWVLNIYAEDAQAEIKETIAIEYEASPKNLDSANKTLLNLADLLEPPLEAHPWEFDEGDDDPDYRELLERQCGSGGISKVLVVARPPALADKYQGIIEKGVAAVKVHRDDDGNWLYKTRKLPEKITAIQTTRMDWGFHDDFVRALEQAMRGT